MSKGSISDNAITWWATGIVAATWLAIDLYRKFCLPKLPYPPGPKGHFLFGNVLALPDVRKGKHMDIKFLEWAKEFGPLYTIRIPLLGRMIIVADPGALHHITVKMNYHKSWTYQSFVSIFGEGSLLITEGDEWRRMRNAFNPGFRPEFLKEMLPVMAVKLDKMIALLDSDAASGTPVHMLDRAQDMTADIIVQIGFGEDWGSDDKRMPRLWLKEIQDLLVEREANPLSKIFNFRAKWRLKELGRLLDGEMEKVLDRRLGEALEDSKDICSATVRYFRQPDGRITKKDRKLITDQLKTFYFAGHETTGTAIAWTIWLLSQHKASLEKLRRELREKNIFVDPNVVPDYNVLMGCEYLGAVIKESLRLYPPAGSARYTTDLKASYNGYSLYKSVLYVPHYVIHRLPQHFDHPDDFIPERFLEGQEEKLTTKFMPFSRGPRDCIGRFFAMMESRLAVSRIVMRYNLECVDPGEEFCYKLTSQPKDGAKVRLTPST